MWGRLTDEHHVIAVNSRGEYFYDKGLCKNVVGVTLCEPEILNIHRIPDTCVAELVVNRGIGNLCLNGMKIFSPVKQEYIYLKRGDEVIIFSSYNDTVNFKCGTANIPDSKQIATGLNKLTVPKSCYARSSELVIYSQSRVVDRGLLLNVDSLDFTKDVAELSGLIEAVLSLNFSRVVDELNEIGYDVKHISVDLASVGQSLVELDGRIGLN
jgi:predicted HAD superfamily phosphohydrolase